VTGESSDEVPYAAHIELLKSFLDRRRTIVEQIQDLLNARRKPDAYLQDRPLLSRQIEDCFYRASVVSGEQTRLRGQLERAHWASGFRPRQIPGLHSDLIHPAEMMIRGFHLWRQTRWPGRSGRVRYAHTLFNVYMLRCLELLSMRLWDTGPGDAAVRLAQSQELLDRLRKDSPADQPVLVRDARWLIPLAQSPTTDELGGYFDVAQNVGASFGAADRIGIQQAGVRMIGGHLRSQIRHYCTNEGVGIDESSVIRRTRTSNALDFALLIQGLVPLLGAYEQARDSGNDSRRIELAGAICQGISPDPEMFLNRTDLLGAYSMIEHLFIATGDGQAVYTPTGRRHLALLGEYRERIGRLSRALHDDCGPHRPAAGGYSPYGAIYGTPSNLTELIAFRALLPEPVTRYGLEDVFDDTDTSADKLSWVSGLRKLPHMNPEVQKLYDYPAQFADDIFARIERELRRSVDDGEARDPPTGRLLIAPGAEESPPAELPARYVGSSDPQLVASGRAGPCETAELLRDRLEGHFIVSFETAGGWVAIRKDMLTDVLGAGRDAQIGWLPAAAAGVLRLMCPDLLAPGHDPSGLQASTPPSILKA